MSFNLLSGKRRGYIDLDKLQNMEQESQKQGMVWNYYLNLI